MNIATILAVVLLLSVAAMLISSARRDDPPTAWLPRELSEDEAEAIASYPEDVPNAPRRSFKQPAAKGFERRTRQGRVVSFCDWKRAS